MVQAISFDQSKGGTTPYMCLANVIKGFGIAPKYPDAWTAWQNTEQHTEEPPAGLDVPVFFSFSATIDGIFKNWGHIGARLANGKFWSDGKLYDSIAAYTANHTPKYVGWGESVNNVTVIKGGNMPTIATTDMVDSLAHAYLNDSLANNPGLQFYVGQPVENVITVFNTAQQRADYLNSQQVKDVAITDLKKQLGNTTTVSVLNQTAIDQIANTNSIVQWIKDKLSSVFK